MPALASLLCGLVFGLGLVVADMWDPGKVLNFLDFAGIAQGTWDPSLALVMVGGIAVTALGYRLVLRRGRPLLDRRFHLPNRRDIDTRLVTGAAVFGIGWGLSGLCPGPAFTLLGSGTPGILVFITALLAGMGGARLLVAGPAAALTPPVSRLQEGSP